MANGIMTGFEAGDTSECSATSGTLSVQGTTTRGAWSGYALRVNPATTNSGSATLTGHSATGAFNAGAFDAATIYIRIYFRVDTLPAANNEEFLRVNTTGGAAKANLRINSTGTIAGYDASTGLIDTGTAVLSTGVWYRIEWKIGTGNGAVYEWKVDGTVDLSTTANLSAVNSGTVQPGKAANRNGQSVDYYFDDILASDSAYPGPGQSSAVTVNGAGNYTDGTATGGPTNKYECVDERPHNSDTDYVLTGGSSTAGTYALISAATAGVSGTINCVKSHHVVKRNGASNGLTQLRTRSGSVDNNATAVASGTTYTTRAKLFDADPATSSAWTSSGIDGLEVGWVDASANASRVTSCVAFADYTPVTASAAVTGTATASITEADVVAGGKTIIVTLTGDTWVASGGTFDAQRQAIIDGLDSAQAEAAGWDAVVKATQGVAGVVRTSDTVVTITLDAFGSYDITATETITVTVPGSALTGASPLTASPTFTVAPVVVGHPALSRMGGVRHAAGNFQRGNRVRGW